MDEMEETRMASKILVVLMDLGNVGERIGVGAKVVYWFWGVYQPTECDSEALGRWVSGDTDLGITQIEVVVRASVNSLMLKENRMKKAVDREQS